MLTLGDYCSHVHDVADRMSKNGNQLVGDPFSPIMSEQR